MKYFKIIKESTFIGIGSDLSMRRFQEKHKVILACTSEQAQYIQFEDKLYHAQWMLPETHDCGAIQDVEVIEITESEYNDLYSAIESGKDIPVEDDKPVEDDPVIEEPDITVEFVKERKIAEMSAACSSVITDGFDVVLSDGLSHHFSLTTQDQLNLITLNSMVVSGETNIPYHADGELCKFYSPEDIMTISTEATAFKTYHVSYFNSLKSYISSLDEISSISDITYGSQIPDEYMSDVLKVLLIQATEA